MINVKDLKNLIKDLPDNLEIRGVNHFTDGSELNRDNFIISKDHIIIDFYIPEEPY